MCWLCSGYSMLQRCHSARTGSVRTLVCELLLLLLLSLRANLSILSNTFYFSFVFGSITETKYGVVWVSGRQLSLYYTVVIIYIFIAITTTTTIAAASTIYAVIYCILRLNSIWWDCIPVVAMEEWING